MQSTKHGKHLEFYMDGVHDSFVVKYDLSTGTYIGKSGHPVKNLNRYFCNMTVSDIIETFDDERYRNYLSFCWNNIRRGHISNMGTFLQSVRKYANFEQVFSAGVTKVSKYFSLPIRDVPKGLLDIIRSSDNDGDRNRYGYGGLKLDDALVYFYKKDPDFARFVLTHEFTTLNTGGIIDMLGVREHNIENRNYWRLINQRGYDPEKLLLYLDDLHTYEALDWLSGTVKELEDYARMMNSITDKYEKFPRNFLTTHRIATRNYQRYQKEYEEELFLKRIDKSLEYADDTYKLIYPKTTQDIKEEGVRQNHCVASYIQSVLDGKCHIMFLRRKDELDKNLITVEIRDGVIVQSRGAYNRTPSREERGFIDHYNKRAERRKAALAS